MGSVIRGDIPDRSYLRLDSDRGAKAYDRLKETLNVPPGACIVEKTMREMNENIKRSKATYASEEITDSLLANVIVSGSTAHQKPCDHQNTYGHRDHFAHRYPSTHRNHNVPHQNSNIHHQYSSTHHQNPNVHHQNPNAYHQNPNDSHKNPNAHSQSLNAYPQNTFASYQNMHANRPNTTGLRHSSYSRAKKYYGPREKPHSYQYPQFHRHPYAHRRPHAHRDPHDHPYRNTRRDPYAQRDRYACRDPCANPHPNTYQYPHANRDPYAHPHPSTHQDPHVGRDPYAYQDPYAHRDPYTDPHPNTYQDPHAHGDSYTHPDPSTHEYPHAHRDPHTYRDPHAHQEQHTYQDPHAHRDSYTHPDPSTHEYPHAHREQHTYQDPHAHRDPYAHQDPYAHRDSYAYRGTYIQQAYCLEQDPYAHRDPCTQQDLYAYDDSYAQQDPPAHQEPNAPIYSPDTQHDDPQKLYSPSLITSKSPGSSLVSVTAQKGSKIDASPYEECPMGETLTEEHSSSYDEEDNKSYYEKNNREDASLLFPCMRYPYFRHYFDDAPLMDNVIRQKVIWDNQHINTLNDLVLKMQTIYGDIEILTNTCCMLIEDRLENDKELQDLVQIIDSLEEEKADKGSMFEMLSNKADLYDVIGKLSHTDFLRAMEELSNGMEKAVSEICRQEKLFQNAMECILWEVGRKMDRVELAPVKELVNINLKNLQVRLKKLERYKKKSEASATVSPLNAQDTCAACNTQALLKECKNGALPLPPVFKPYTNLKPFLTYELDKIRKNPQRKRICIRYCGGSHTIMFKRGTMEGSMMLPKKSPRKKLRYSPGSSKTCSYIPGNVSKTPIDRFDDKIDKKGSLYSEAQKRNVPKIPKKIATQTYTIDPDFPSREGYRPPGVDDILEKIYNLNKRSKKFSKLPIRISPRKKYQQESSNILPSKPKIYPTKNDQQESFNIQPFKPKIYPTKNDQQESSNILPSKQKLAPSKNDQLESSNILPSKQKISPSKNDQQESSNTLLSEPQSSREPLASARRAVQEPHVAPKLAERTSSKKETFETVDLFRDTYTTLATLGNTSNTGPDFRGTSGVLDFQKLKSTSEVQETPSQRAALPDDKKNAEKYQSLLKAQSQSYGSSRKTSISFK